jgi:hypothetical protein
VAEGLGQRGRMYTLITIGNQCDKNERSTSFLPFQQIKRFAYTLSPTPLPSRERGFYAVHWEGIG